LAKFGYNYDVKEVKKLQRSNVSRFKVIFKKNTGGMENTLPHGGVF